MPQPIALFWFRRDLRLHDNAGLYHALKSGNPVVPLFIFDREILDELPRKDARVEFIHQAIHDLSRQLQGLGSALLVRHGRPADVWLSLLEAYDVAEVYTNHDYEPYALERDTTVRTMLEQRDIPFRTYKDHVIFEHAEVLKDDGTPYTVFTPYSKKWLAKLNSRWLDDQGGKQRESFFLSAYPNELYFDNFLKTKPLPLLSLSDLGFDATGIIFPPDTVPRSLIKNYDQTRDFPALDGTSRLGLHYRFGTISIRAKARAARDLNGTYLNELIWRDFYSQILAHFPHVADGPFKKQYARIEWRDAPEDFRRWCEGRTGYPLVDAGMRQLNATGFMHNRVRMVAASFLSKHLLINWQHGEAYFAEKLLDFDLASNSGGWQWAAGCGTDAAPYFRVFNPTEQAKKFDPKFEYVREWVPEFGTPAYPEPMVEHVFARERCLAAYKKALRE